jgi:membrane-associated phospholipid phosphatase
VSPTRRFWLVWGAATAAWAAGLALLAPYDLALSRAWMERDSQFGQAVFHFGEAPGWLSVVAALCVLAVAQARPRGRLPRALAWHVLFQALAHPLLLTQALKFLWGRVRPLACGPDFAAFAPFWQPAGPMAGESFPSGHVAMALVAAPLVFWLWRQGRRRAALAVAAALVALGLTVAAGRVVSGSHFATDTWFSFGSAFLVAALWGRAQPSWVGKL